MMMGEFGPLFVLAIIAIVTFGKMYRVRYGDGHWSDRGARRASRFGASLPKDGVSLEEAARMKAEITRLNERIQVLERLATDPSKRLSDEIDALGGKH